MVKEIHITKPITYADIINLLNENPDLKKITCARSVYNRISKKYLEAFEEMNIDVEIKKIYNTKTTPSLNEEEVVSLAIQGKKPKEIHEILDISTKRVYYLLSKNKDKIKLNNYKRKYDLNQRKEIKSLNNEGYSAKKISSMKNIPLRSVYYILNNK